MTTFYYEDKARRFILHKLMQWKKMKKGPMSRAISPRPGFPAATSVLFGKYFQLSVFSLI